MLTESLQVQAGSPTLSTVALISIVLLLVGIIWLYARPSRSRPTCSNNAVQILLLGDIGHSPRMQNHALSIAKKGGRVTLIGYEGCYPRRLGRETDIIAPLTNTDVIVFDRIGAAVRAIAASAYRHRRNQSSAKISTYSSKPV